MQSEHSDVSAPAPDPRADESNADMRIGELELRLAIDVLGRAKCAAVEAGDFTQAADLRAGQFRLQRLLTNDRDTTPTDRMYAAGMDAFRHRTAYWAPETFASPDHIETLVEDIVDAAFRAEQVAYETSSLEDDNVPSALEWETP